MSGRIYRIVVTGFKGEKCDIDLCNTDEQFRSLTVLDLKRKIIQKMPRDTDIDRLTLIFVDERLDNENKLLIDYGIQHLSVIQVVLQVDGGGPGPAEGNMGDRDHKNLSMDRLADFETPPFLKPKEEHKESCVLL